MATMNSHRTDMRLQALTHWNNRSNTSIHTNSDATTYHLAHEVQSHQDSQHLELHLLKTLSPIISQIPGSPYPSTEGTKMARKDSGWSQGSTLQNSAASSRRNSTSTARKTSPSRSTRRPHRSSNSYSSSRPSVRRASKSSPQTSQIRRCQFTGQRPGLNSRHTIQTPSTPPTKPQFFHFPHFPTPDTSPTPQTQEPLLPQQPPPTVNYWTSDDTRRLEYAAIDAASRGIRGFITKLIPECMLSKEYRRTRFCKGDEGSDAGSVRRYRLDLPEDEEVEKVVKKQAERAGGFRRWSGAFNKTA